MSKLAVQIRQNRGHRPSFDMQKRRRRVRAEATQQLRAIELDDEAAQDRCADSDGVLLLRRMKNDRPRIAIEFAAAGDFAISPV